MTGALARSGEPVVLAGDGGEVLDEGAAEGDVDELEPRQTPSTGMPQAGRGADEGELEAVAAGVDVRRPRAPVGAVQRGSMSPPPARSRPSTEPSSSAASDGVEHREDDGRSAGPGHRVGA